MVIALLAALKAIPDELYEAAEVDGSGPFARFRNVTMPRIWNTVVVVGLVLGILAFYSFDLAWIMTKGGPQDGTAIVGIQIYRAVFLDLRPAYAAAISVVMLVILFIASLFILPLAEGELMRARSASREWLLDGVTVLAMLLMLTPVIWIFLGSIKPEPDIMSGNPWPTRVTFDHYIAIWNKEGFLNALRNSLIVGLVVAVTTALLAAPAAYSPSRFAYREAATSSAS